MRHRHKHSSSSLPQTLFSFFSFILPLTFSPYLSYSTTIPKAAKPADPTYSRNNISSVSAILVFGDSTVDPGNNNNINTIFKSNFPPYGQDFEGRTPTGRFCNGRLVTDFIALYMGVKENVPAYLDSKLGIEELMSGVSFASAASGFDPLTPALNNVIDIPTQLGYFREYKKKIEKKIGKQKVQKHVEEAVFFISAGTNDFMMNYYMFPERRTTFMIQAYQRFVIRNLKQFLQRLWEEGARRIAVVGLPPMGCLPEVITLFSAETVASRRCVERFSTVAGDYNVLLQKELNSLQLSLAHLGSKIVYIDIFTPLSDMISRYPKYGFNKVSSGCCGTGYVEYAYLCNSNAYVCSDTSKYLFFDSIHLSEKAYYNIFKATQPIIDMIISGQS